MTENKRRCIERMDTLHEKGQDFIARKKDIPLGLRDHAKEYYFHNKEKILKLKNANELDWNSWGWQFNNRIASTEELKEIIPLTDREIEEINLVGKSYRWSITPYYTAIIDPDRADDAVKKISLPTMQELSGQGVLDPTGEEYSNPAGIITRRYPDRLILNVTNACACFCRHCQRRRNISAKDEPAGKQLIDESIKYIEENTEIRDVLITGGDPLTLSDTVLEDILSRVRKIEHVEIIRIGSRTPVTMPQRITENFVKMLKKYLPVYFNTHFNHPQEITEQSARACTLLRDNGIALGNQMVLLKGVNDDPYVVRLLNQEMLKIGVRPYYIFHAKNVIGTLHFQTPVDTGIKILEYLQGNTSGLAIPNYIVSAPGGLGKIPLHPNYIVEDTEQSITLRTWEKNQVTIQHMQEE